MEQREGRKKKWALKLSHVDSVVLIALCKDLGTKSWQRRRERPRAH